MKTPAPLPPDELGVCRIHADLLSYQLMPIHW